MTAREKSLEAELRALRDTIVDGLIVIDVDKRIRSVNRAAERIFGYRAEEVVGRNVGILMPGEERAAHDAHVDRYLKTGEARIVGSGREVTGERKDGSPFPMSIYVGEMRFSGERRFLGVVRDLSESYRRDRTLRRHEEMLHGIAANLPGSIFRGGFSPEGRISFPFVSDGLKRVFALDPAALQAEPDMLMRAIHQGDRAAWLAALEASARELAPLDHQMRVRGDDGEERWMHAIARPVRRADGGVSWSGLALDVTDRQTAQAELHQAQKMEAVGQLTGGMAHDFNNLLAVLSMDLEELEALTPPQDERRALIDEARETERLAAELTERLLAFARKQPLNPRTIEPAGLLVGTAELLHRTLGGAIRIDYSEPGERWCATVDPVQLENAVINLAINARDAMPNGGTLTIVVRNAVLDDVAEAPPGAYVCIEVSDTGTGMPPAVVERAFEPFFTTKKPGQGTGMGLSMVYGFVKQSSGHIAIDSRLEAGTTVRLYFPRTQAAADESRPATGRSPIAIDGCRVLYVEDHPQLRARTEARLAGMGLSVVAAPDGRAALDLLDRGERFDLLFTDVVMPGGVDGIRLADAARRRLPDIRVLYTTGYADDERLRDAARSPGAALLRKPFTKSALRERLQLLLE
ncbi:MAG: PAS domain S-box protein [Defluviicoccus sp.]|nr:PAS domain S-box protein [Defluviicoccus sp.]MDE0385926.1 PAS domain S-box protein [Defluviicoccus sp.]